MEIANRQKFNPINEYVSSSPRQKGTQQTSPSIDNKAGSTSKKAIFSKNQTPNKIPTKRESSGEHTQPYDLNEMA